MNLEWFIIGYLVLAVIAPFVLSKFFKGASGTDDGIDDENYK